ncbi:efflux transporter outer membrane subunit [Brachymonas denitrificans]|uniref:Outer membrane protein, multidrug efflux system n=1 Tax=Brachymonas denitrificans DSM 15123 TaxID=1121117 RepID=A0A1H8DWR6_9BURK|nr:outer membrane protein, multidrug efflux system [Brachymonas denitrificans DSM 15123]
MMPATLLHSRSLAAALVVTFLSGCSLMPTYERPDAPVPAGWQQSDTGDARLPAAADIGWQQYFADARLRELIGLALQNNRDLRVAALNIEAARAQYGVARADQLPTVGAGASMTRSRTAADASPSGRETLGNIYSANLASTGFELDFFGRVRSMSTAALNQYLATQEARDAAQISLIAEVAKAYVAQRTADEAMRISKMALDSREKTYRLAKLRFNAGVISAIDLRQNETLIESAHADYAAQTRLREQAGNALALLIGQPVPANLPPALPLGKQVAVNALPVGMSSDVLLRRPDIRQSEYQLQAANANIGAARAAFFPRISLTGSFGSVSRELDGLFTGPNMAWSFMPQISLPIFDFGRNQSNLDLANARKNIAVAQYEKSIQGAFREVADQLAARRTLADQLAAQERGYQAERERLRLVQMRYDNGISSSLDLLDAQRQSYALEQALLLTRQAAMNNRIDLYKVLGGGLVDVTAVTPVSAR